jgi:hypothetical protein
MTISSFGILFIPIAFWIFLFLPRYLVPLMVLSSVFSAASVVDFSLGDSVFGIQPFYFAGVLVAIRTVPLLLDFSQLSFISNPALLASSNLCSASGNGLSSLLSCFPQFSKASKSRTLAMPWKTPSLLSPLNAKRALSIGVSKISAKRAISLSA